MNFSANEQVLCFHGPLIYEARILKAEWWSSSEFGASKAGAHYFVHYKGWKQTWDEWVPETRILKLNQDNIQKQQDLQTMYAQRKNERAIANKADLKRMGEKASKVLALETEEEYLKRPEIRIPIPDQLKVFLIDDWEFVTKDQRLVSLPRTPCVTEVLDEFRDFRLSELHKNPKNFEDQYPLILNEFIEGMKLYFEKALPSILLYRQERQQYAHWILQHPSMKVADVYGAEHFLRLFVQLPSLIAHTTMDQDSIAILKEHFHLLLVYLMKNSDRLFLRVYENAPPEHMAGHK